MRVLVNRRWRDDLLDYWRAADEYRIQVRAWATLSRIDGLYFVRGRSMRTLLNYLAEVEPADLLRKVRSRLGEAARNEKFLSVGLGSVIDGPPGTHIRVGRGVAFVAPTHPECVERVCLPAELLRTADLETFPRDRASGSNELVHLSVRGPHEPSVDRLIAKLAGWSPHSGWALEGVEASEAVDRLTWLAKQIEWEGGRRIETSPPVGEGPLVVTSDSPATQSCTRSRRPRVALSGFGHYAKTIALPGIEQALDLVAVSELDPLQIPAKRKDTILWDTSPTLSPDETHDVYMLAGYHHTHSPLASEALRRGSDVILEKPIAVDRAQVEELIEAARDSRGAVHVCFQRRYTPFNEFAREDLRTRAGEPISYHCIVYEVPLPPLHWYRWPSSGSRLISNGCHWVDHFLFLNDFRAVLTRTVSRAGDGTISCMLELDNGAVFTMVLTDKGSERLGVQDHVELRANGVTATITNNCRYRSESDDRVLRRKRISRGVSYRRMYESIGQAVSLGAAGDSPERLRRSAMGVIELEEMLCGRHSDQLIT